MGLEYTMDYTIITFISEGVLLRCVLAKLSLFAFSGCMCQTGGAY